MGLLDPPFTVTVTVQRPAFDNRGNPTWSIPYVGPAVVSVEAAAKRPRILGEGQDLFIQDAMLFIPRGTDVRAGDHVIYNNWKFIVAGRPRGDQPHPFTGSDFGWMAVSMQAQG